MAFQFSTRTILLVTACIAIVLASQIAWLGTAASTASKSSVIIDVIWHITITSPLWSPLVWAAYAIGRRQLTVAFVVAFAVFELLMTVVAMSYLLRR